MLRPSIDPVSSGREIRETLRLGNGYPLLALWGMGIRKLRVPFQDLLDADRGYFLRTGASLLHLLFAAHRCKNYDIIDIIILLAPPRASSRGERVTSKYE
jgi:hypothetical protein